MVYRRAKLRTTLVAFAESEQRVLCNCRMSWQRESIDTFLIIFTLVVALIALLLVIFVFFKGKLCPRRSIYASQSIIANDTAANLSPSKIPLR